MAQDPPADRPAWTGEARSLVGELHEAVGAFRASVSECLDAHDGSAERPSLDAQSVLLMLGPHRDRVTHVVARLDALLERSGFAAEPVAHEDARARSLGTYDLRFGHRAIHNGFLEPVRRLPIVASLPDRVVAYLITIERTDDLLQREKGGGVGWHYHYLNKRRQRSDVLLAWDTRATAVPIQRGFFAERHAERGKAFTARPTRWADEQRRSMHEACRGDLSKWDMSEFRNPSDDAHAVWPRGAMLTPRPSAASSKRPSGRA